MAVLSKLLKYDLRANLKIFLFIWPAILVFGLLERVALMAELPSKISAIFVNLTTVLFVLAVIAACVFALVISVIRFYSGLLRDEGYLMFTLPVRPWQLVLSKLLTAFLTLIVTGLVSFVSVGILFGGIRGLLPSIRTSLEQSFGGIINGWGIALLVLLVMVQVAVSVLQIYLSCSIGHLFRRKRILFAVLFYYAINVVLETVAVTSIIVLSNFEPFCRFLVQLYAGMSAPGMFNLFIGVVTALLAVLVLPKHKDGQLPAFFQLLFDAFTPKTLLLEKILQVLNVFFSLVTVLLGLVLVFQGLFANTTLLMMGLLLLLLGPLLCRVGYELILLRIMQVKATREINRKLSFLVPDGAAQAAEEEDLREEPEKEAPTTAKTPTEPPRAHCPSCGTWYQEALGKCPVCGRAHEKDES